MVIVCGEALVDVIVDAAGEVTSVVGGAGLNTARTIGRLGQEVRFLGGLSCDALGRRIERALLADGVQVALEGPLPGPSALAIAQIDDRGAATYRFLLERTATAALSAQVALAHADPSAGALHLGGLGLVLEPLADASLALADAAGDEQVVMVDPNYRPGVMAGSAVFTRSLAGVLRRADIVKASVEDLAHVAPDPAGADVAKGLVRRTGAVVVVTDGARPVRVLGPGLDARVEVPATSVVDTVGAGDAFGGALLAWWQGVGLRRSDLADHDAVLAAVRFGVQVAARTCQRAGADPPWARESTRSGWTRDREWE